LNQNSLKGKLLLNKQNVLIGGDDIDQLIEADEAEFKEITELVGMSAKPLHVKRLRKAIDEYKNSLKFAGEF
jgi:hypothetical protein